MNNNSRNFLVGTIEEGITTNTKPWATQKDSWERLVNMYQWRGRLIRKSPYSTLGQLSHRIVAQIVGASAENFTANLFAVFSLSNVTIVPGFTTITVSGGANYTLTEDRDNPGSIIYVSGTNIPAFEDGSINYLTGALTLNFAGAPPAGNVVITFSYAYGLPVMGLPTRNLFDLNAQDTIAFDTVYSYRYNNSLEQFVPLDSVMPTVWSGTNSQFFFTTNYAGAFWATNFKPGLHGWDVSEFAGSSGTGNSATVDVTSAGNNVQVGDYVHFINLDPSLVNNTGVLAVVTAAGDPFTIQATNLSSTSTFAWTDGVTSSGFVLDSMQSLSGQDGIRYYGDLTNGTGWANYNPPIDANNALAGALLIFPYRGYLVFLNTWEGNEEDIFNFGQRARWTQIGTPYYSYPVPEAPNPQTVDINAVRDDLFGRGGANDAPTQEVIVGAAFIRDILVVRFERSTWRLRFVNNAQNPFVWERINIEFGSGSTFSSIVFDKGSMDVSPRGITIADPNDVVRIDDKIPNEVFEIRNQNEGFKRVYGIRTFRTRLNYWTIPDGDKAGIYPDYVLLYNYETQTWATLDDCFTCFGYFYSFSDTTWGDLTEAWSTYIQMTWGGNEIDANSETIIAGNQQGFVLTFEVNRNDSQPSPNAQNGVSLMIDSIINGPPSTFSSQDNNLPDGSWVVLSGIAGTTDVNGVSLNGRSFKVINPSEDASSFTLQEFKPYAAGNASGASSNFTLSVPYIPIFPGSVNIWVGSLHFTDNALDGVLTTGTASVGTINYNTGEISLTFSPSLGAPTPVYIYLVSKDPDQELSNVETTGTYTGGGYISKTSNFIIQSKVFNFLPQDKRSRLSKIDFYMDTTTAGEFTVNVFADSSKSSVNRPLRDNPRSNVVKTTRNPYQFGNGDETIFRLFCDAVAQTIQIQGTLSDQQMAVPSIAGENVEILAMNFNLRPGGRLV